METKAILETTSTVNKSDNALPFGGKSINDLSFFRKSSNALPLGGKSNDTSFYCESASTFQLIIAPFFTNKFLNSKVSQIIAMSFGHKPTFQFIVVDQMPFQMLTSKLYNSQQGATSHFNNDCLRRLIVNSVSGGAQ